MISVVTWLWGDKFAPLYVDRLRSMFARHLRLPHEIVCVTDRPEQVRRECSAAVRVVPMPLEHAGTLRCRRRMWHYAAERANDLGSRILACDLDVVVFDDLTPIVDRPEPVVLWRVGYANVYSGSFQLFNAGALDGAWRAYRDDPDGFPAKTGEKFASDQAMLNFWLRSHPTRVAQWTERDGFVTWFGKGYERLERHGMGPTRTARPPGSRILVMGSADKHVLDGAQFPFVVEHWR